MRKFEAIAEEILGQSVTVDIDGGAYSIDCSIISEASSDFRSAMKLIGVPDQDAQRIEHVVTSYMAARTPAEKSTLKSELRSLMLSYRNEMFFKNLLASRYIQAIDPSSTTPTVTVRNARDL